MKVFLLGDPEVGKTNLLCAWANATIHPFYSPTIGVDFKLVDDLQVWDGAGERSFSTLVESYVKGCDIFIVAYTWKNVNSMKSVMDYWIPMIQRHKPVFELCLVRCQKDLDDRYPCPDPNLEKELHRLGYPIYETSSLTKEGVDELFDHYNVFEDEEFFADPDTTKEKNSFRCCPFFRFNKR